MKPVYKDLLLPDLHFALFGCKIAQGLAEGHRDVSPVAAALAAAAMAAGRGTTPQCRKKAGSFGGRMDQTKKKWGICAYSFQLLFSASTLPGHE